MSRPTSERQIAANRANSLKSTGPRTAEGKARVSLNSMVHGLRSSLTVLAGEDKEAFEEIRQAFLDQFQPNGPVQLFCVEKMIESYWRSRRIPQIESELFAQRSSGIGIAFIADPAAWDGFSRLSRYETSLDRTFYRALNELQKLQRPTSGPAAPPRAIEAATCQNGFARQSDLLPVPSDPQLACAAGGAAQQNAFSAQENAHSSAQCGTPQENAQATPQQDAHATAQARPPKAAPVQSTPSAPNGFARQSTPSATPAKRYLVENGKLIPIASTNPGVSQPSPSTVTETRSGTSKIMN